MTPEQMHQIATEVANQIKTQDSGLNWQTICSTLGIAGFAQVVITSNLNRRNDQSKKRYEWVYERQAKILEELWNELNSVKANLFEAKINAETAYINEATEKLMGELFQIHEKQPVRNLFLDDETVREIEEFFDFLHRSGCKLAFHKDSFLDMSEEDKKLFSGWTAQLATGYNFPALDKALNAIENSFKYKYGTRVKPLPTTIKESISHLKAAFGSGIRRNTKSELQE